MSTLELMLDYAKRFIGKPYLFGGDDPVYGFDCSGLVCEILRAAGLVPYNFRTNAQGLYDFLLKLPGSHEAPLGQEGRFVFFGKSNTEIIHVGFCLDSIFMLEAGGGDSTVTNDKAASVKNAFVKIRRISYRKDYLSAVFVEW